MRRRRWALFSTLALMYILVYFYRVSLAVVAGDVSRDLGLSAQDLGTLSGALFYIYAAAQLPLGPLIDRAGPRLVISVSGVLTTAGGICFALAGGFPAALAGRLLLGVGTASVLMATFTIFSHWYDRQEFGRISGLMVAVGNLGNLAGTAPLALAVGAFGWRGSFLAVGAAQALVTLLVWFIVRDRPPGGAGQSGTGAASRPGALESWKRIFGSGSFWLLGGVAFAWFGNYMAVQGLWGGPYLREILGLTRQQTGSLLMFTSLGFIAGCLFVDWLARVVLRSYKRTLIAGQLLLLLLMTSFLGPAEHLPRPLLSLVFFLMGLAVSSGVLIYPVIRAMFAVEIVGTALTSLNFFVLMGAATLQQAMGFIVGRFAQGVAGYPPQAYHAAFLFPVVVLAVAIALYCFARDYTDKG